MTTTTRLTLEEFLRLPETKPASEFDAGEVSCKSMPNKAHSVVQKLLTFIFTLYLRSHPIGDVGPELRCVFGPPGDVRAYVPDIVFVRGANFSTDEPDQPLHRAPDLAVEILSPDDRMSRVMRKVAFYLANGLQHVWVIDPQNRTVTIHTPPRTTVILTEDDTIDAGALLPDFRIRVSEILPQLAPPAQADAPEDS